MRTDSSAGRFLLVGFGNTLAGLGVIYTAKLVGASDIVANAIGYAVGLTLGFYLNRRYTFRHDGPVLSALARFITVLAVAYCANLAVVLTAIVWFDIDSYLSQALGVPVYTALSYAGSRWYAFPEGCGVQEPSV